MAGRRQTRIQEAERHLAELLESAPDAILELDHKGHILLVNRMAAHLFGYSREELLGQTVELLVPESLRTLHTRHRARYVSHPATRPMGTGLKLQARRKDGSHFSVEISLSPVKSESGFHVAAIIRDITERCQLEDQLRMTWESYMRELDLRSREAERANQLKTEFLANMSHELRSPLHTVIGFAELLAEESVGPLNEKQKRFINHIYEDSQHLLELINDLLDLSKIEAGRLDLQQELFRIEAVLEEAVFSVQPRAAAKPVEVLTDIAITKPVCADRTRFKQILHNLLSNAVKFTPAGGRVRVEAALRDRFAEISVSDTGIGIQKSSTRRSSTSSIKFRRLPRAALTVLGLGWQSRSG
jgi:PAS domain S-box-containing protein